MSSDTAYDGIVMGGGPAGSTTAPLLAQRGRHVLVLGQAPRFHVGESLLSGLMGIVEELGLTERLDDMDFQRTHGISLVWGEDPSLWAPASPSQ